MHDQSQGRSGHLSDQKPRAQEKGDVKQHIRSEHSAVIDSAARVCSIRTSCSLTSGLSCLWHSSLPPLQSRLLVLGRLCSWTMELSMEHLTGLRTSTLGYRLPSLRTLSRFLSRSLTHVINAARVICASICPYPSTPTPGLMMLHPLACRALSRTSTSTCRTRF